MINVAERYTTYDAMMENIANIADESYVAVGQPAANTIYRIRHVTNNRSGEVQHSANFFRNFVRFQLECRGNHSQEVLDAMTAPTVAIS